MIIHQQFITNWNRILNRYCLVVTMDFYEQHIKDVQAMISAMRERIPKNNEIHQIEVWRKPKEWITEHQNDPRRDNVLGLSFS